MEILTKINPATMAEVKRFGGGGVGLYHRVAYDGTYIYASMGAAPATVVKVNRATMVEVTRWDSPADAAVKDITTDGTYVYAAIDNFPAAVAKIRCSDMVEVDRWTGAANEDSAVSVAFDGTYIYAGLWNTVTSRYLVIQIIRSNMTENDRYTTPIGGAGGTVSALCWDGTYLYYGLKVGVATVVQIDVAGMTQVDRWTSVTPGDEFVHGLSQDGTYIYASVENNVTLPGALVQLDPSTMDEVDRWPALDTDGTPEANDVLGAFVYVAVGAVVKVDPSGMAETGRFEPVADFYEGLTNDGTYIYAGGSGTGPPARPAVKGNINVDQLIYQHAERMVR